MNEVGRSSRGSRDGGRRDRKRHAKHRRARVALGRDRAAVRTNDLLHDVKAETQSTARLACVAAAPEGLEELWQETRGNGGALVGDREFYVFGTFRDTDFDRRRRDGTMLDCIANEIAADLREAIAIPAADARALHVQAEETGWVLHAHFFDDGARERLQIHE